MKSTLWYMLGRQIRWLGETLMKKLDWLHWVLLAVILVQGFYLWVTPYEYRSWRGSLARISRFSGRTEVLNSAVGWKVVGLRESPTPRRKLELIKHEKTGQYALWDPQSESIFMYLEPATGDIFDRLESQEAARVQEKNPQLSRPRPRVRELSPDEPLDDFDEFDRQRRKSEKGG